MTRQRNLEKRVQIQQRAEENRPHVVLGTKAGDEEKWTTSDLARVLVKPEELKPIPWGQKIPFEAKTDAEGREVLRKLQTVGGDEVVTPKAFSYGITEPEKNLLFNHLPYLNAEFRTNVARETKRVAATSGAMQVEFLKNVRQNTAKASMLARVVDLVNANKGGIMYENRRRVIEEFSEDGKKNDTGRPEVQGASVASFYLASGSYILASCPVNTSNPKLVGAS
ncbi:hypothetical protein EWM64_g4181 [Hericium alpestre]|uniref:Uncharacterized protein n=1 Tax=Hericium alpestre TaxID=135208 RepID=A0A4Z0A0Y0_9AGAM|nr:hypothetical protein EWM64_g4181 [Hericium alpestre]